MPWPLASDFQTILQNPKIAFRDPYLRSCSIERDARGQPRAWAGQFAVVYKGVDTHGKPVAIRVFSTESPHRRDRYAQIGDYLSGRQLHSLVSFEYRDDEIRSLADGNRYPIVLMTWVEGETLFERVQSHCRSGDRTALWQAAQKWPALVAELSQQQIAHGDLQHANIMVTPDGEIKLVDYDGMCVPALIGADCLETGTPPYQHPLRSLNARLSARLDDFSALVIYVALHALAHDPALWEKYIEKPRNDKLLFREDDFHFPHKSALRRDLFNLGEPNLRYASERLFAAAAGGMDDVPSLEEVIQDQPMPAAADPASRPMTIHPVPDTVPSDTARPGKFGTRMGSMKPAISRTVPLPRVPGYELISEIGKGLNGTVVLATSESTGQQVAVKLMPINAPSTEIVRRRFLLEMDREACVRGPNIVGQVERGMIGHSFYFVSDYCNGGNLLDRMAEGGGKFLVPALRPVMQQCLDALKCAHLHRLVHGNITPRNVLFAGSGQTKIAKISDFGLSMRFERSFAKPPSRSIDLQVAGFMPRERFTSEHGLNSKSDLWSLAAVFYYALSGCYPWEFGEGDPRDVIVREEPVPLSVRESAVSARVAEVIDRALRVNPAQRFSGASEMKSACDAAFGTGS
jgi:serine/threonine protein kinase